MNIIRSGATEFVVDPDPRIRFGDFGADANAKLWQWRASGNTLLLETLTDAGVVGSVAMTITRSGTSISSFSFGAAPFTSMILTGGTLLTTAKVLTITATIPESSVGEIANSVIVTGGGTNASGTRDAFVITLAAGYTGGSTSRAVSITNASAGTGALGWAGGLANYGVRTAANGITAGNNTGNFALASGSSTQNLGIVGNAISGTNSPALNIGVGGIALSATVNIGGFFGLFGAAPGNLSSSAALMCDNSSQAADIFVAKDNGTAVFTIADGGNVGIGISPLAAYRLHVKAASSENFVVGSHGNGAQSDGVVLKSIDDTESALKSMEIRASTLVLSNGAAAVLSITGDAVAKFRNVTVAGWGIPAIYASARSTAQTAAVASVATYTVGAADGTFRIGCNVNVTTATAHNFAVQVDYTDETNTTRTLTLPVAQLAGTVVAAITNVTGAGPYEGISLDIRCKAATSITIKTSGTFTTVTYNVEGSITQIA